MFNSYAYSDGTPCNKNEVLMYAHHKYFRSGLLQYKQLLLLYLNVRCFSK
jgi:hypothetical protein